MNSALCPKVRVANVRLGTGDASSESCAHWYAGVNAFVCVGAALIAVEFRGRTGLAVATLVNPAV